MHININFYIIKYLKLHNRKRIINELISIVYKVSSQSVNKIRSHIFRYDIL